MRAALLLLLAVLGAACERSPTRVLVPGDEIMVHAMFEHGSDSVLVLIQRAELDTGPFAEVRVRPVAGATVELTWSSGSVTLTQLQWSDHGWRCPFQMFGSQPEGSTGCYMAVLSEPLRAGESYRLEATLLSGESVRGVLELPSPPLLVEPATLERFAATHGEFGSSMVTDSLVRLSWVPGPQVAAVTTRAHVAEIHLPAGTPSGTECHVAGPQPLLLEPARTTSAEWRLQLYCGRTHSDGGWTEVVPDSARVRLTVDAYDERYLRYVRATQGGSSARRSEVSLGLEGAVGLFSGMATAWRDVMIFAN